jgi:hypothetical protein
VVELGSKRFNFLRSRFFAMARVGLLPKIEAYFWCVVPSGQRKDPPAAICVLYYCRTSNEGSPMHARHVYCNKKQLNTHYLGLKSN